MKELRDESRDEAAPVAHGSYPLIVALTSVISHCHIVVVGMIHSQFHHFAGEAVVACLR